MRPQGCARDLKVKLSTLFSKERKKEKPVEDAGTLNCPTKNVFSGDWGGNDTARESVVPLYDAVTERGEGINGSSHERKYWASFPSEDDEAEKMRRLCCRHNDRSDGWKTT